ncbi:MAG: FAD-dependent monooxygenase, partial [Actinomycetota bacterium]|nr:FAD-dependent monooxygenase [Actinomycetota bacterium]
MWDVAVIGAGPAGASAALSARYVRPDARVLLLDRSDFPRDKACGDGIAPHALDVLASVGVVGIEAGYAGIDRLRIGFSSGPATDGVMARAAYVIPREIFDARLVETAVLRGAEFRRHRVRTVAVADDGSHAVLDGEIRARVVIAADGASSVIRRQVWSRRIRASTWPAGSPLSGQSRPKS